MRDVAESTDVENLGLRIGNGTADGWAILIAGTDRIMDKGPHSISSETQTAGGDRERRPSGSPREVAALRHAQQPGRTLSM